MSVKIFFKKNHIFNSYLFLKLFLKPTQFVKINLQ